MVEAGAAARGISAEDLIERAVRAYLKTPASAAERQRARRARKAKEKAK